MPLLLLTFVNGSPDTRALLRSVDTHGDYVFITNETSYDGLAHIFSCPHESLNAVIAIIDDEIILELITAKVRLYKGSWNLALENLFKLPENHVPLFLNWYMTHSGKHLLDDVSMTGHLCVRDVDSAAFYEITRKIAAEQVLDEVVGDFTALTRLSVSRFSLDFERELHPLAQRSYYARRYHGKSKAREQRTEFQRDRERILHSKAFRRMVDKAQIFTSSKGDHYRTRLTHTLEVSQIARGVARALSLNEDLTEAIALGHDLGHTPFGHEGERELDFIMSGATKLHRDHIGRKLGGFKHNYQGIRIVCHLEEKYILHDGLDLSYQVLEGILKHTRIKKHKASKQKCDKCTDTCYELSAFTSASKDDLRLDVEFPSTLEGQIVYWADEIAQRTHDLDDGIASGVIDTEQLVAAFHDDRNMRPLVAIVKRAKDEIRNTSRPLIDAADLERAVIVNHLIHFLLGNMAKSSVRNMIAYQRNVQAEGVDLHKVDQLVINQMVIGFDDQVKSMMNKLEDYVSSKVINSEEVNAFDGKSAYIIRKLFKAYYTNPKQLPNNVLRRIRRELTKTIPNVTDIRSGTKEKVGEELLCYQGLGEGGPVEERELKHRTFMRCVADHIGGMTDDYATEQFKKLYMPSK